MKRSGIGVRKRLFALTLSAFFMMMAGMVFAEDPKEFIWATQLGGNKGNSCNGMAVDREGNVYVTGMSGNKTYQSIGTHLWHSSGGTVFLAKFNPAGKLLWCQYAGGNGIDAGLSVAVNDKGAVYVTGYFSRNITFGDVKLHAAEDKKNRDYSFADIFLARYDIDGKLLWVRQAGGTSLDQTYEVAADKDGNAYITGYFQEKAAFGKFTLQSKTHPDGYHDPDTRYGDVFVAKYDSAGNVLWVRQAGEQSKNAGYGIAVDAAGNVYATGRFEGGTIRFNGIQVTNSDLCNFVVKYDRDGNVRWAQPTAGVGDLEFANNYIAVDNSNNVIVAGSFIFTQTVGGITLTEHPGGNHDVFVAKYDSGGKVLWCKQAGGEAHDTCHGLAVDEDGNAYIMGSFMEQASFGAIQIKATNHDPRLSGFGYFVACYDSAGDVVGVKTLQEDAHVEGIAINPQGHIYLAGGFRDSVTFDSTTLKAPKDFWGDAVGDIFVAKLNKH